MASASSHRKALWFALCHVLLFVSSTVTAQDERYAPFYANADIFLKAIGEAAERPSAESDRHRVTGITVPHHLLAADLMALGFTYVSNRQYDRVILLTPDHFKRSKAPFATSRAGFDTVLGAVDVDSDGIERLAVDAALVEVSDVLAKEHGLRSLLPFVKHYLPTAEIVPIAISLDATIEDWERLVELMRLMVTERTLIVQSTDFSHYLPHSEAVKRDQEVLNILSSGSAEAVARLLPVEHLDSIGSQYVHMRLQRLVWNALPVVVANKNSQAYTTVEVAETTSYVVQVFHRAQEGKPVLDDIANQNVYYFAGDTLFGRNLTYLLADPRVAEVARTEILGITRFRPIVLNLEGVILDNVPDAMRLSTMTMPARLAIGWLHSLGVVAVSLANNHTFDMGPTAFAEMEDMLEELEIQALRQGETADIGPFRLTALTDFKNARSSEVDLVSSKLLDTLFDAANDPPLFAFVHWGREGEIEAAPREDQLSHALRMRAYAAIIGAHSHRASDSIEALAGGQMQRVYSLGNFIFDQTANVASGKLLEVRFFEQGTFFSRLIELPNIYDVMRKASQEQ